MNTPQMLVKLDWVARWLNMKDVIGLLDDVDRYGRMYAARVVIVGDTLENRQKLAAELVGRELDRGWVEWGEFGVSTEARAGIGAEIVVSLDEQSRTYEVMCGLFLMRSEFEDIERLRDAVREGFARRSELQEKALRKIAVWCLREVESLPHPPPPSPNSERGSQTAKIDQAENDQLRREIGAEIEYLTNRVQDDFGSLRYRKATVEDLESFNAAVNAWLVNEKEMIGMQLGGLIERVARDVRRMEIGVENLPQVPPLNASAPELTTRPIPPDDRLRTAVSLGGGGLIAVVSQVLLSHGPVAALATGAAAGMAAYVALSQKKSGAADPVQTYFELMERTTIADLRRQIEGVGAALTSAVMPIETVVETRMDEIGMVLAEVQEALGNS